MNYPMRLLFHKSLFLLIFFTVGLLVSAQFKVPQKPSVLYPVYDEVGLLTAQEKDELNQKLIKFNDSTSVQIAVVIVPTTNGEDVNFAAWQIGEQWGLRNKNGVNNGIVFLIAKDDRTMSIQQGRDVEQHITASIAGQILDYLVTPSFKQGNFFTGINRGTSAIMDAVRGKFKPIAKKSSDEGDFSLINFIIIIIIVMVIFSIISKNNRGGGNNYDDDDVILSRRGRRTYPGGFFPFPPMGGGSFGRGGGSFGGGGFGGFGGGGLGGFGGGGASGSW